MNAKYIAPVLVILLCGVAITGAGYAYTSQLDNGTISGTDATFFQIALDDKGTATYEKTTDATIEFNQTYNAKTEKSTFKTAGNVIGEFKTALDANKSHDASEYKLTKVTVTCDEEPGLVFDVELNEDGTSFTVSIKAGQEPAKEVSKETKYTLNVCIQADAVEAQ